MSATLDVSAIRKQFADEFVVRKRTNGFFQLTSPFVDTGGSNLRIFIKPTTNGGFIITDLGEELMTLDAAGVNYTTPVKHHYIEDEKKLFGVAENAGQYYIRVSDSVEIPTAVQNFLNFLIRIDALTIDTRERTPQVFKESVADFLYSLAEEKASFKEIQNDAKVEGKAREYRVDFLLTALSVPTIIEPIAATTKATVDRRTPMLVSEFLDIKARHSETYRRVVVYDDEPGIVNEEADFGVLRLVTDNIVAFTNEEQLVGILV